MMGFCRWHLRSNSMRMEQKSKLLNELSRISLRISVMLLLMKIKILSQEIIIRIIIIILGHLDQIAYI